jgi:hypothetical protein
MRAWLGATRTFVRSIAVTVSVVTLTCLNPTVANAKTVLTYYLSRAGFNAAEPGLPLEDFQPTTDPGLIAAPLSSSTNNIDFPAGNILSGITFSTSGGDLYVFDGALSTFMFERTLILDFAPGANAVGLRWFGSTGSPGGGKAGTFTARMFNGATLVGAHHLSEPANIAGFFGVSSTTDITKIDITFQATCSTPGCDPGDANPFIDNIAFGAFGAPASPAAVPEPSSFMLILSACIGFGFMRRTAAAR